MMPLVSGSPMILTRNLLYTAITRAKKFVVLVGEEYNVRKMVKNDYVAKRYSALKYFMTDADYEIGMLFGRKDDGDADYNEESGAGEEDK